MGGTTPERRTCGSGAAVGHAAVRPAGTRGGESPAMATSMITPDPAADAARRRGLRRMRTLAVSLLLFAAVVYVATLGPDGFLGLRQRRRRGLDGRRDRRLVRGDRAVQAPARAADPAHRADPASARTSWAAASRSSSGRTSCRRTIIRERIAAAPISQRVGQWLAEPGQRTPGGRRGRRRGRDRRWARCATSTSPTWSSEALVPRFREEPISPLAGSLLAEVVRDDLHHGLVDLALDELHRWLVEQPGDVRRGPRGAGAVVDARRGSTRRSPSRLHLEAGRAGSRDIRGDPHHHAREALDSLLAPARRRPAARPRHPGAHRAAQGAGARPPAGGRSQRSSLWNALPPRAAGLARRPRGCRAAPARWSSSTRFGERLRDGRGAAGAGWTAIAADLAVFGVARYGDELDRRHHPHDRALGRQGGRRAGSSCTSAATCSSSGSTAPSSAAWSAC